MDKNFVNFYLNIILADWQATYLAFLSSFPVNFFYTLSLPYDGLSDYIPNDN